MAGMVVVFPDGTWCPIEDARVVTLSDDELESKCLHAPIPDGEPASAALAALETVMDGKCPRDVALHVRMLVTRYADPEISDREKDEIRNEIETVYLKAIGKVTMLGSDVNCTTSFQRRQEPWTIAG